MNFDPCVKGSLTDVLIPGGVPLDVVIGNDGLDDKVIDTAAPVEAAIGRRNRCLV